MSIILTTSYQLIGEKQVTTWTSGRASSWFRVYAKYNSQSTSDVSSEVSIKTTLYVEDEAYSGNYCSYGTYSGNLTGSYSDAYSNSSTTKFYVGEATLLEVTKTVLHDTSTGDGSFTLGGTFTSTCGNYTTHNSSVTVDSVTCKLPSIEVITIALPTVQDVTVEEVTETSAFCYFSASANGGTLQDFGLILEDENGNQISAISNSVNYTFTGLNPDTAYYVYSYAVNELGRSESLNKTKFTTLEDTSTFVAISLNGNDFVNVQAYISIDGGSFYRIAKKCLQVYNPKYALTSNGEQLVDSASNVLLTLR